MTPVEIGLAVFAVAVPGYLAYRGNRIQEHQNRLLERQNEIMAGQEGKPVANPVASLFRFKRNWPLITMSGLTVLVWVALGIYLYQRHYGYGYDPDRVWDDNAPLAQITNRAFKNETIQIDGRRFVNCDFNHVTFSWRGTGRFDFVDSRFVYGLDGRPTNSVLSKNLVVNLSFILFNNMLIPSQRFPKEILQPAQVLDGINK